MILNYSMMRLCSVVKAEQKCWGFDSRWSPIQFFHLPLISEHKRILVCVQLVAKPDKWVGFVLCFYSKPNPSLTPSPPSESTTGIERFFLSVCVQGHKIALDPDGKNCSNGCSPGIHVWLHPAFSAFPWNVHQWNCHGSGSTNIITIDYPVICRWDWK